jgi:hypothetical protein
MEILAVSSGNFFMAYISSYADVASKSPSNFSQSRRCFIDGYSKI